MNSTKELIEDISKGKMVVLLDDEDRENEGDLVLAAEKTTPELINFMATHARGLICLALTNDKCEQLNLEMMVKEKYNFSWDCIYNFHRFCKRNNNRNFSF